MATLTVTSASNTNLNNLRDASFSAYLSDEAFVVKLGEVTRNLPSAPPPVAETVYQISLGSRRYAADGEINIFDAEKYFKAGMDDDGSQCSGKIGATGMRAAGIRSGAPSTCSDSTWNSQNALLRGFRRETLQKQSSGKRFLYGFVCNCSGKKSVDIDEKDNDRNPNRKIVDLGAPHCTDILMKEPYKVGRVSAAPPVRLRDDDRDETRFSFPVQNSVARQLVDDPPRYSLEVFGSPVLGRTVDPSEHRRLMMNLNLGPRLGGIPAGDDDDLGSDSSSDLFELGGITGERALTRQSSDEAWAETAAVYEPSEASIEWSVVTASANGQSVAGSEYGDGRVGPAAKARGAGRKISMVKEAQRRQSGSLLGCRSSKAVSVVADVHKPPAGFQDLNRRLGGDVSHVARSVRSVSGPHLLGPPQAVRLI